MSDTLNEVFERDRKVWDECAQVYEEQIVGGHPEVLAYEAFEEDLLDRMLLHLIRDQGQSIHLMDVGCGSGRLHFRYGLRAMAGRQPDSGSDGLAEAMGKMNPQYAHDPILARGVVSIDGLDFSQNMLDLAREKLCRVGLGGLVDRELTFQQGSAFDLAPLPARPLPVAVTVCNSIGVMQGPAGAVELFKSMRRAVESAGGIAMISGYSREAVKSHALGNYESTMDVCGQPRWLGPDTYSADKYIQRPRAYKRAFDPSPEIIVDVYDRQGALVKLDHVLTRIPSEVEKVVATGQIRTYTNYESNWYGEDQFARWIGEHWSGLPAWHVTGRRLDGLRGAPAQLAVLDCGGRLDDLKKMGHMMM